ncbi:uncharacterized protein LOC131938490 [Physella acuta]|uniref:uncharacterized protein LOC131938490 n=1 Tax=Physella acuta TaxID=109671 RepID=UPI0027DAEDF1|nr:uncharacterized protein LOC131938490 [Physella acuta]
MELTDTQFYIICGAAAILTAVCLLLLIYCCCKCCCVGEKKKNKVTKSSGKSPKASKPRVTKCPSTTIDLHGHSRQSAIQKTRDFIWSSKQNGTKSVKIITGRGKHSPNGFPVIRETLKKMFDREGIKHTSDNRGGAVVIDLQ